MSHYSFSCPPIQWKRLYCLLCWSRFNYSLWAVWAEQNTHYIWLFLPDLTGRKVKLRTYCPDIYWAHLASFSSPLLNGDQSYATPTVPFAKGLEVCHATNWKKNCILFMLFEGLRVSIWLFISLLNIAIRKLSTSELIEKNEIKK